MKIMSETAVCDIAIELPAATPVLERLRIDYCSTGKHHPALYRTFRGLEQALHQHFHFGNDILFPRVLVAKR